MPEPGTRPLAGGAPLGIAGDALCPRGLHSAHELAPLALQNKEVIYALLFRCSAETLIQIAGDPKHLDAEIGFFSVLHTWNQKLLHHPDHGFSPTPLLVSLISRGLENSWGQFTASLLPAACLRTTPIGFIPGATTSFLPVAVLSEVFRSKFVEALKEACASGKLHFHGLLQGLAQPKLWRSFVRQLFRHRWVVYCKPPFGGPDRVLRYLGASTHPLAISNHP